MAEYTPGTVVAVRPYVHRPDGEAVIIGDVARDVYLSIPAEGLDILHALADGKTVAEAARAFEDKHHESVDINDFLRILDIEGFVQPKPSRSVEASTNGREETTASPQTPEAGGEAEDVNQSQERERAPEPAHRHRVIRRFSFDWISPTWAKRLTGKTAFFLCSLVILAGMAMAMDDPGLVPGSKALLFEEGNVGVLLIGTFVAAMVGVSLHEIGHAMAARSVGVSAKLGISNLMYILVAQTDITGVWMISRGQRIKAYLAGLFVDLLFGALLVAFLYGARNGFLSVPQSWQLWAAAVLVTYMFRVMFQFFFYLRTDIYFVLAAWLNCKNLMADTERLLNNLFKRLTFRGDRIISQQGIPRWERRRIRGYAVFYVLGRVFAIYSLVFLILPVLWGYIEQFVLLFAGQETRFTSFDFAVVGAMAFLVNGGGLVLWAVNAVRRWRHKRERIRLNVAEV